MLQGIIDAREPNIALGFFADVVCIKSVKTNHSRTFSPCAGCGRLCHNGVIEADDTPRGSADDTPPNDRSAYTPNDTRFDRHRSLNR
ncbi:hypothetical protein DB459_25360 [Bradyrhizobium sp. WD16]|nr:hypothetical protein DB459_25360 [Bradyrhizobium sp. WD16]